MYFLYVCVGVCVFGYVGACGFCMCVHAYIHASTCTSIHYLPFLIVASYEELKDKVMASLKEAESLEENWRQSASETARRRKVLEVQ